MKEIFDGIHPVHYLPILTTLFSAFFLFHITRRYRTRGGTHLLWWAIGVFTYGFGTLLESIITLNGNTATLNKLWYVAGAILGGYPLAQGSVFLHFRRRTALILTAVSLPLIVFASIAVLLSPTITEALESFRPGGAAIGWQWVRLLTPFINGYAAIFLIGSAAYSAVRFSKTDNGFNRAFGNTFITIGAILPGIGGGMAKAGMVEALYVGEFVGILLIFLGYIVCLRDKRLPEESSERNEEPETMAVSR
jgi:hypothetical protein